VKSGDIFNITDIQTVWDEKNFANGGKPKKKLIHAKNPKTSKTSKTHKAKKRKKK